MIQNKPKSYSLNKSLHAYLLCHAIINNHQMHIMLTCKIWGVGLDCFKKKEEEERGGCLGLGNVHNQRSLENWVLPPSTLFLEWDGVKLHAKWGCVLQAICSRKVVNNHASMSMSSRCATSYSMILSPHALLKRRLTKQAFYSNVFSSYKDLRKLVSYIAYW